MNWPIEALNIIPPIIFIVLVIAFPLIGLAAGWKRAAFWGGGNLLFYLIGLMIWRFAGEAIVTPILAKLKELLAQFLGDKELTPQLAASLLAPVWFLLWMMVSELILLINYYAWYKKVVGLKKIAIKDKKTGKIKKQYTKVSSKAGTVGYKVGNRLGGVALLGVLTLPTTIAFTQLAYCGVTSSATRKNNNLSANIYKGLLKLSEGPFGWLTYSTQSCRDFDAAYSALILMNAQIGDEGKDIITYMEEDVFGGIEDIMEGIQTMDEGGPSAGKDEVVEAINTFADNWNTLVEEYPEEISAVFSSPNAIDLVQQFIPPIEDTILTIDSDNIDDIVGDNGYINTLIQEYFSEESGIIQVQQVEITEEAYNSFTDFFINMITFEGTDTEIEENKEKATNSMKDIISLLFVYPGMPDVPFTPQPEQ